MTGILSAKINVLIVAVEIVFLGVLAVAVLYTKMLIKMSEEGDHWNYLFLVSSKKKFRQIKDKNTRMKLFWYYGLFEEAYNELEESKRDIFSDEMPPVAHVIWGWHCFESKDLVNLKKTMDYYTKISRKK